jgi:hypothetical protein
MTVKELFDDRKFGDLMARLCGRWQDEREYEDFEEYKTAIARNLPPGFTLVKATKRPFGFVVKCDEGEFVFTMTSRGSYSYKRAVGRFAVGDRVRINSACRPEAMIGCVGAVLAVRGMMAVVLLDGGNRAPVRCPLSILDREQEVARG